MSALDIGINDVSEETKAFKDRLASKDGHIAAQETRLMKQAAQLEELRSTLNEALHKLTHETNRVLELESTLEARSQDLLNEKIASQNVAQALAATQQQIKEKDREAKDLQVNLESVSRTSDGNNARCAKLRIEKATLEAHIRDLQANLQQLTCPPITPSHKRAPRRSRSSSVSEGRIPILEQELLQLRALVERRDAELVLANEKISQAQSESIRAGNEKMALEKKTSRQISDLSASLEEKEEELSYLRRGHDTGSRERELMDRIEEDGAKISALERLLGERPNISRMKEALREAEEDLREEHKRVQESESRQIELVKEKEEALDQLEHVRQEMDRLREGLRKREADILKSQSNEVNHNSESTQMVLHPVDPSPPSAISTTADEGTIADIARLLAAVERIRGERDELRRSVQFLETEYKFAMEELESKRAVPLASSMVGAPRDAIMQSKSNLFPNQVPTEKDRLIQRLYRAVDASAIALQHTSSRVDECENSIFNVGASRRELVELLDTSRKTIDELGSRLTELQVKLDVTVLCLEATTTQRNDLISQQENKESEHEEEIACLNAAHQQTRDDLKQVVKSIEILESERNSLRLQVTNLSAELQVAQDSLVHAESRYSELQFHQLSSLSSNDANQLLRDRLAELEMRVMRRTEQIGIHQHDIKRMETNLRLQEERLAEMTTELETISSQKDAMVEDCADARDARDAALARLETFEQATETRLDEADNTVEALVGVIFKAVASTRNAIQRSNRGETYLKEKLVEQHAKEVGWQSERDALINAEQAARDDARESATTLALLQEELGEALRCINDLTQERDLLRRDIQSHQEDLVRTLTETQSLKAQLDGAHRDTSTCQAEFENQISALESQVQDLCYTITESEARHQAVVEELRRSAESLQTKLDEAQQFLVDNDSEERASLKTRYTTELDEAKARFMGAEDAIEKLKSSHVAAMAELETSLADSLNLKLALEQQLGDTSERLRQSILQIEEFEHSQEDIVQLRKKLDSSISEAREAEKARDEVQASFDRLLDELSQVKKDGATREAELSQHAVLTKERLESQLVDLQNRLDTRNQELDQALRGTDKLKYQLEEEAERHTASNRLHDQELALVKEDLEAGLAQLRQDLENVKAQLKKSEDEVEDLQRDKLTLQGEMTNLEAEIQRSISLRRFLDSQVEESRSKISSLTEDLDQARANLVTSEKSTKAAEINLSLQNAQHKREMSDLQRQLATLQSQPDLQAAISELEERNNAMEDLLRSKCAEIEANDDHALEMLKDNKRLKTRVESLTRKVQSLQTKLAAAKAISKTVEVSNDLVSAPPPPELVAKAADAASTSHPQPRTLTNATSIPPIPTYAPSPMDRRPSHGAVPIATTIEVSNDLVSPPPPEPIANATDTAFTSRPQPRTLTSATSIPPIPTYAPSAMDRRPSHRAVSSPSLRRPSTPERRLTQQPAPVFKARTPERPRLAPTLPDPMPSASTIGKKRRAPDDFEACESVPPQGFTADSLPSRDTVESTTPRVRRVLSSLQSGFTPKRHQNPRPVANMPSPRRPAPGVFTRTSPVIADVTNSPRGPSKAASQSAKEKRSWLGKIRGQATSRPMDSSRARSEREFS